MGMGLNGAIFIDPNYFKVRMLVTTLYIVVLQIHTLHNNVLIEIYNSTESINRRMPTVTTVVQTANELFEPEIRLNSPEK